MATTINSGRKRVAAISEQSVDDLTFSDTRQKISRKESRDIILECQDGKLIYACRLSLMSYWAWFKENFASTGDARTLSDASSWLTVPLPDIASSTLLIILEYLHTGKMSGINVMEAVGIVRACKSKYFQLPKVEDHLMHFLETTLSNLKKSRIRLETALELSLAEFRTPTGASTASLSSSLEHVYTGVRPSHLRYLSEKALRLFLDNTKSPTLFGEYLLFRRIIIWCATHASPAETKDEVIEAFVPDLPRVVAYLRTSPSCCTEAFDFENLKCLLKDHQRCAAGLLEKVNFVHIHSKLLDAVVEPLVMPLKLVSEERMREAYKKGYRFQALPGTPKPPQYVWDHRGHHSTDGDGSVIAKANPGISLARYPVPVFQNHGVYEWAIVIEKPCLGFCEIGFITREPRWIEREGVQGYCRPVSASYGRCLKITARTLRINQGVNPLGESSYWDDFGNKFKHLNARVKFRLDLNQHACSIAINDDKYLPAWENLPSDVLYYPAVCLGIEAEGQVRIHLLRGFDMV